MWDEEVGQAFERVILDGGSYPRHVLRIAFVGESGCGTLV